MKRARETAEHITMKQTLMQWLLAEGYLVKAEESLADLVAFRPGEPDIVAIECERSPRNAIPNIRRDLKNGATYVIVVVNSSPLRRRIQDLVARKLPRSKRDRVKVISICNLPHTTDGSGLSNAHDGELRKESSQ